MSKSMKLDKPAMVGNTRFGVGIEWATVIDRAQREYEYRMAPEKKCSKCGTTWTAPVDACPECSRADQNIHQGEKHGQL